MTTQTSKRTGEIGGFVEDLNGAVRENPVAAALIGVGMLWMFVEGARGAGIGSVVYNAAKSLANEVGGAAEVTGNLIGETVQGVGERIGDVSRGLGDAVSSGIEGGATMAVHKASVAYAGLKVRGEEANGAAKRVVEGAGRSSSQLGREEGMSMQQNLAKTLEAQPLLLGIIGVAIGASIASAFPSTRIEQDAMGEAGAALKDAIQEISSEATARAKDVFVEVKKEASAQGLTPDSAREGVQAVADKVKAAAAASQESIRNRIS